MIDVFDLVLDIKSTNTASLSRHTCEQGQKQKTYNSWDSLVVTHPNTNRPVCGLCLVSNSQLCQCHLLCCLDRSISHRSPFKEPYGDKSPYRIQRSTTTQLPIVNCTRLHIPLSHLSSDHGIDSRLRPRFLSRSKK